VSAHFIYNSHWFKVIRPYLAEKVQLDLIVDILRFAVARSLEIGGLDVELERLLGYVRHGHGKEDIVLCGVGCA
jgi:hypothetical protein